MKRIFYLLLVLLWVACENDDSFSTSTGLRLSFSVDTLQIDTIFSRTPSSTYAFWVHNHNDDGIRISTVKLKRGNQSGYRVNVDGVYLDNSNGSQTNNVEIRRKDSLLVFVELTAPETRQKEPLLVEDDLLFALESGAEQKVCLRAWAWDAQRLYDMQIKKDTVIETGVPLIVYGTLQVDKGVKLTIKNTDLYFHDGAGMNVDGQLETDHVTMRGDRLDDMFDYLPYDRVSNQWEGVRFSGSSTGNVLKYTEIRNADEALVCDSSKLDLSVYRLEMDHCIVHNSNSTGVKIVNSYASLNYCQLTNAGGDCLAVYGGEVNVNYCTIAQFYPFSADRGAALFFSNRGTTASANPLKITCIGSIMTGYEDDVVMGDDTSEAAFEYHFANCLLRTPAVDDAERFTNIIWEKPDDEVQGKQHFVKIDEDNLDYDFHLDEKSTAKGMGCY